MIGFFSRFRALARNESGITLVEILVATVVTAIIMVIATSVFINAGQATSLGKSVNISTKAASLGLNELSSAIRFSATNPVQGQAINDPAIVLAKNDQLILISYLRVNPSSPQPVKVQFSIDGSGRLIEVRYDSYEISPGFWGFYATSSSSQILTGALIPPSGTEAKLFTYLDSDNNPLTVPNAGLTLAQRQSVAAIKVSIKLKSNDANAGNPVKFENVIGMPNVGINRTGQ
ncbi:MAG: prepilin-type N-terminal cleavage/methylation domain-containing protein [Cryobacterium sp.]|nr:prepilin-type N-terminal cleavage/methylation domain-containing protein [Cryobacterium sp.]